MSIRKQVKSISDIEFARKIALDLLSIRPRSESELRTALAKRNVPDELIDELCGRFTEVGLLDDAQFASMLVASRSSFSHHGKRRIRQELRNKGVPDEHAQAALDEIDDDAELDAARAVAQRKMRSLSGLEPHVAKRRLAGALARRGFGPGAVMQVTNETLVDLYDEEW